MDERLVIDVGCAPRGVETSIERLIKRFQPSVFYGFDPAAKDLKPPTGYPGLFMIFQEAAWTKSGFMSWIEDGITSRLSLDYETSTAVPTIDLGAFIEALPAESEIILKLDCEGAEIELLKDLHERSIDNLLSLVLVEYHCPECGWGGAEHDETCSRHLRCRVEFW